MNKPLKAPGRIVSNSLVSNSLPQSLLDKLNDIRTNLNQATLYADRLESDLFGSGHSDGDKSRRSTAISKLANQLFGGSIFHIKDCTQHNSP